ncbi:MAG: Ig-like domain-containing protein [Gammaproteobacteria bacterium]
MKFSWRATLCAVVLVGATSAFTSCKTGPSSGGEDPPTTHDDKFEVTGTAATALGVLDNDTNLAHPPLTYSISQSATAGSASFNPDNTVRLDLPSGFRGATRFKYKVTNSVGGFSISTAVVFVDVPAYRALFAAKNSGGAYELYVSDLISSTQVSQATSGNLRLQHKWRSHSGLLIAYERADPAQPATTAELYFVRPGPNVIPTKFPPSLGRAFIDSAPVALSDDDRWMAYATAPTSAGGQATNLYVLDANSSNSSTLVNPSANLLTNLTQWVGTQPTLYFMATPGNLAGPALYRASVGNFDAAERISPVYSPADTQLQVLVSPDQTRVLIVGTHGGQAGAFLIDPSSPNIERRVTTDIPAGALIESYQVNDAFTQLTYLWRSGSVAAARLSVVDLSSVTLPRTVLNADIASFTELRPDGLAALVTRSSNGRSSDGTLVEVTLDRSVADLQIAANVTGGIYADTADRVYLYSRTLTPSVIERSNFNRAPTPLVRSTTPASALFVSPSFEPSAAILEDTGDTTLDLVLVNASAPGKTLQLSTQQVGPVGPTLLPTIIDAAP